MQHKSIYKYLYSVPRFTKFVLLSLTLFLGLSSFAQIPETNPDFLRTKNWTIGNNILLEFGDSIKATTSNVHTSEAYASFSTKSGKLLYYSDAVNLYDSNSNVVSSLKGDKSSVEGVLISGNDSILNVLTTTDIGRSNGAHFYTFKNGIKTSERKILSPVCEMQGRVKHSNQREEWITLHKFKSDSFYIFLLKDEKIICPSVNRSLNYFGDKGYNAVGSMKFSPSGNLLCINHYIFMDDVNGNGESELYKFDKEQGVFDFMYSTGNIRLPISCEFTTNEDAIYISERGRRILRYELSSNIQSNFRSSQNTVWTSPNSFVDARLQRTIQGQIVVNLPDSTYLAIIQKPDTIFPYLGFNTRMTSLNGKKQSYGLPNFNASYFHTPSIDFAYTEDCWQHNYSFEGRDTLQATSWKWIFNKGSVSDTLFTKHCNYTFPNTGKWEVSHIAIKSTKSDTITKTLTIHPKWGNDMLGSDTFYCTGDSIKLILQAPENMHCIHWGVNGHVEEPNLDESLGPIVDYDYFQGVNATTRLADTAGTYIIKVTNKTFCQAWDTITVSEYQLPNKSGISKFNDSIVSNTVAHTYRWYRDGVAQSETTLRSIDPDSNGYWQVQLVSEFGCDSELSDSLLVDFASIKPLIISNLQFTIYPNPSDGHISILVPKEGKYTIQITDLNGKLVYSTQQNLSLKFELDFVFAKGSYILTLTDENGNTGSDKIEVVR